MSVLSANIGLAANYLVSREVVKSDFIDKLDGTDSNLIKSLAHDRGAGISSLVVFVEEEIENYKDANDPDAEFHYAINAAMKNMAQWLALQSKSVFEGFLNSGLKVWVYVELWIDGDQLDMSFPSQLLAECGRLEMSIDMATND